MRLNSEDRRASIVDAACLLFAEKGFRGTTTRELAAAVGVTEPILYEHFKTKRDLYSAIIEKKSSQGTHLLNALRDQYLEVDDDRGYFFRLGMLIIDWYTSDPTFVRLLLFSNLEGHELKELFHNATGNCFDIASGYLERRIEKGAIKKLDASVAARAFFGMVAHYSLTGLVFGFAPFAKSNEEVVREMVGIFMDGICQQEKQ
ncbi:MAG: TetR/AcrR family transcriptional regulator [Bryobacteraceae bacterium]